MKKILLLLLFAITLATAAQAITPVFYLDCEGDMNDNWNSWNAVSYTNNFSSNIPSGVSGTQSCYFDGSEEFITDGGLDVYNDAFTIAYWVNTSQSTTIRLYEGQGSIQLNRGTANDQDEKVRVYMPDDDGNALDAYVNAPTAWSDGAWHHHVLTVDGHNNNFTLYVDGVAQTTTYTTQNTPDNWAAGGNRDWSPASYPITGNFDEIKFYDGTLTAEQADNLYACDNYVSCNTTNKVTIRVRDLYDDGDLSGVNVTFSNASGVIDNVITNAQGIANITYAAGSSVTYSTYKDGYYNASGTAFVNATTYVNVSQANYTITGTTALVTGNAVTTYNVTVGGKTYPNGETIYLRQGTNNLTWSKNGWYPKYFQINVTGAPTTGTANVSGVYDAIITVTAKDGITAATVNTFSVNITQSTYAYESTSSTTNGTLYAPIMQGLSFGVLIDASGYSYANTTLTPNNSTPQHNFSLYATNTFIIDIYDETNNSQITGKNFTVLFITSGFAKNSTYTGTSLVEELLVPGDYEIRYYEEGVNATYTTKKSYFVTLDNRSYENIRLYHIPFDISGYYIPVVLTSSGYYSEGTIVKAYRGYVEGTALVGRVVEMAKTDPNGQAVFRIEPNNVFYKFTGESSDESFETNYFKITQETHTFQLSEGGLLEGVVLANSEPYTLEFLSPTNTFRLTWDDSTNNIIQGCLEIKKYSSAGETTVTDTCNSGASGSTVYMVTDTSQTSYVAKARLTTTDDTITDTLTHNYKNSYLTWGLMGVFLTLIVFLFAINMASTTEGVVVNGSLAIVFMGLIGIFAFEWTAIVGILILAGVIIYKSRT